MKSLCFIFLLVIILTSCGGGGSSSSSGGGGGKWGALAINTASTWSCTSNESSKEGAKDKAKMGVPGRSRAVAVYDNCGAVATNGRQIVAVAGESRIEAARLKAEQKCRGSCFIVAACSDHCPQ